MALAAVIGLTKGIVQTFLEQLAWALGVFNALVEGQQKFWNRPAGAEAVLQVRVAYSSEDGRLERSFA